MGGGTHGIEDGLCLVATGSHSLNQLDIVLAEQTCALVPLRAVRASSEHDDEVPVRAPLAGRGAKEEDARPRGWPLRGS